MSVGTIKGSMRDMPKLKSRSMAGLMWGRFRRNRAALLGGCFVVFLVLCAIFAPWIAPYSYTQTNFLATYQGPSWAHLFGTDELGRDMLSRLLFSLRTACIVGFGAEAVELSLGMLLGAVAGYVGGTTDAILMRFVDVVYGFPSLLFSIVLVVLIGHSIGAVLIAVAATSWVGMARIVRSQVMTVKYSDYVTYARSMGATWWQIVIRYVLPNSFGPIVV
ncbi:MAG: ABC transporter permease, partial [Bacilli bacterium]